MVEKFLAHDHIDHFHLNSPAWLGWAGWLAGWYRKGRNERKEEEREDDSWNFYKRISRSDCCKTCEFLRFVRQVSIRQFLWKKEKAEGGKNIQVRTLSWQAGKKEGRERKKRQNVSMDWWSTDHLLFVWFYRYHVHLSISLLYMHPPRVLWLYINSFSDHMLVVMVVVVMVLVLEGSSGCCHTLVMGGDSSG